MDTLEKRLANLELEFLNSGGGVEPYQLEQIFTINQSKKIFHSVNVEIKEWKEKGFHPYVVRSSINNGIKGFISESEEFLNPWNTITFAQDTFFAFYQKKPFFTWNWVKVLALKNKEMTEELGLFLAANINFKIKDLSWWVWANMKSISEIVIHLPTLSNWEIAYDYMEEYIKEIEAYHVKEIEAYLKATGLSNYELKKDEVESLKTITQGGGRKFTLDELFDVSYWNADIQKTDIWNQWDIVVSAWENNYWIIGRTTKQSNIFDEKTITIDMFWYAFLRTFQYKMVTHGRVLSLKPKNKLSNDSLLYMLWLLKKTIHWYWFDNMLTWKKIKENVISLPVYETWEIVFNCINSFNKATQKLVIKDLVDNINRKLETYKEII